MHKRQRSCVCFMLEHKTRGIAVKNISGTRKFGNNVWRSLLCAVGYGLQ